MQKKIPIDRQNKDAQKPVEPNGQFITVFTDASHCPDTNAYGLGVWIKHSDGKIITLSTGGIGLKDSTQAEYAGINYALNYIKANLDSRGKILVLQCDSIAALEKLDQFCVKVRLQLKFLKLKHVKGHTNGRTRRTRVNSIVDRLAYNAMVEQRAKAKRIINLPK